MPSLRVIARSFTALLAVFAVSACSKWPPQGEELVAYVNERKSEIETLVSEFRDSEYGRITCRRCWAKDVKPDNQAHSEKFIDGSWQRVENPKSRYFAELLKAAGVYGVSERSGGETELTLGISAGVEDPVYVIQLFHDPDHRSGTYKECVTEFKGIECGVCKVSIDESLWIRYQWYPKDIDPELTEAGASGEIGWDEFVSRRSELHDACVEAGLLEQGYERVAD